MKNINSMYAVSVLAFVLMLSTLVGVPVLPKLSIELGAGTRQIPLIVSASLATVVITQFFIGALADRFPAKNLLLIGAFLGSVSSFLCVVATNWLQLFSFRILGGIADAISMPVLLTLTASLGKEQPGKFFGILRSSQGLSFILGPALGSIFSLVSLRTPFLVDGALSLIACIAVFVLMRDGQRSTEHAHSLNVFRQLRTIFRDKRIYIYLLFGITGLFGFGILYSFVPTKSHIIGLQAWQIGLILGSGALIFSGMSFLTGVLSDKYSRRPFIIASQIIIVISGIALALSSNGFVPLLLIYCFFCAGEAMAFLLCFVYASRIFEDAHMGSAMGAFDAVLDLSLLVGPLIGITVFTVTGQIALVFYLVCIPAILGLLSLVFYRSLSVK